jgi:hypothetical protein
MSKSLQPYGSREQSFTEATGKTVATAGIGGLVLAAVPFVDTPHAAAAAVVVGAGIYLKGLLKRG